MAFMQSGMSAEALAAASELGVPVSKNPALMAVINDMLRPDSLPPGWEARYDQAKERREYYNEQREVQYTHPLVSYYRGAAFMEMGGIRQLQSNEADQPPAPQEVLDMCAYLGVSAREDDPYVVEVARLAISAPLPPHWEEGDDEDGNPLFTNRQTGQSQPSHPLDPYFIELIKRRKRELAIHSDGVGIRSALAAKRLHEIGVPGVVLPPELKADRGIADGAGGGSSLTAGDAAVDDVDDEHEDEEEDEEQQGASSPARNFGPLLTIEEAEEEGHDDEDVSHHKAVKQPPQQQQQQEQKQQHLLLEDFDDFEEEDKPQASEQPPPPPQAAATTATASEAVLKQEDEAVAEEVDTAEAERRRQAQWELNDWAKRHEEEEEEDEDADEKERKAEAERQQMAQEEEKEREVEAEAEWQRLNEQEREREAEAERKRLKEQEEKEKAAAKAAAERQALLDALREADGDLMEAETDEEEEGEEEVVLPTVSRGIANLGLVHQIDSMDSGISATTQLLPQPTAAAIASSSAAEDSAVGDDDWGLTSAPHPSEPAPAPASTTAAAERLLLREESTDAALELAPAATPVPAVLPPPRSRGRRKTDDDNYDDDFESYCSDFESYTGSRQATRDGCRTAGTTRGDASSRPLTTSRHGTAAAAVASTPPPQQQEDDDDEYGGDGTDATSRLPSPPAEPPPGSVTSQRHSTGGSRLESRDSRRRAVMTRGSSRARSAAASLVVAEDNDERVVEPDGEDGDDEDDEGDAVGKARQDRSKREELMSRSSIGGGGGDPDRDRDEYERGEDDALATIREQAAEAARRAEAAAAEFNAKFPPLPVSLDEGGGELRRSRSYSDVETGRLLKQLSAIEAARSAVSPSVGSSIVAVSDTAATAATARTPSSIYAVARLPSGRLELLRSRVYGSSGAASAAAAAAAAVAEASPPSRNRARTPARERIRVAVRARPVPKSGELEAWHIDPASRTVRLKQGAANSTHRHISADRVYSFDLVLGPESSTKQLWVSHVVPLMDASLGGVNTTVFAYGQTGSGKTFTMFGSDGRFEDGAIAMSLTYLFKALQTLHKIKTGAEEYSVKISMLELYNEQLRDLLAPGGGPFDRLGRPTGAPLALQDDPRVGVRVNGLEEHAVADVPSAMALVARGAFSRSIGSTAMNEVSSRSHTIVRLALETREAATRELLHTSLVSFVDLAGSERLAKTGSTGARFVEGTNINISLLMLGTVVSKLAEGRVGEFIPYRNSKLTRLLQPCLGGNSKTAIIATINPSTDHIEETFNTLAFATRAMDVVNQVSVNSYIRGSGAVGGALSGAAAAALQKQVATLKAELAALKKEAGGGVGGGIGIGSGTALLLPHDGGGSSAAPNVALMAERLARLEIEKARLLDRLEVLTGRPQGDVYDEVPPTPPDLSLPPPRPPGRSGSNGSLVASTTTPSLALRSIARLACVGGRTGGAAGASKSLIPRPNEQIPPEEVVTAVRNMRDERDELRRRDAKLRQNLVVVNERLAEVEPYKVLSEQVKEVVGMLENILGPSPLAEAGGAPDDSDPTTAASNQAARLAENVQAVAMMHNELAALQRQLATSEAVAAVAARRSEHAEAALQRAATAAMADWATASEQGAIDVRLKNMVEQLNSQLTAVRRELDVTKSELAKWRGLATVAPELGMPGAAAAAAAAATAGDSTYGDEDGIDGGDPARRLLNPVNLNVGSFALRRAREAIAQASAIEARCNAAEAERDGLRERLQALEEAMASGAPPIISRGVAYPSYQGAMPGVGSGGAAGGSGDHPPTSNASLRGGPPAEGAQGQQRFDHLVTHVSSLSREVSALTRERDTLLGMVLRMQAPQQNGILGAGSLNPLAGGQPMGPNGANLMYGGIDASGGGGYPFGTNNVFSSVPMPPGTAMDPRGHGGGGSMAAGTAMHPRRSVLEVDPMMAAALIPGGGSPVKLKPLRGRVPHHHHRHRYRRDGAISDGYGSGNGNGNGNNDISNRPEFNARDMPLEAKHRVNRLRDRANRLDAPLTNNPQGSVPDMSPGVVGKGLGPMQEQEPVLYGHRDAEVYALKRKLVLAEKARSEAVARTQSELRDMQYGDLLNYRGGGVGGAGLGGVGGASAASAAAAAAAAAASMGYSTQMALVAANRDFKEQARSHAAEMRQLEVSHEENLAATRAEAAAVFKQLVEENNRLKIILAVGGSPGGAGGGGGGGGGDAAVGAPIEFPLRSLGGFGGRDGGVGGGGAGMRTSYSESPPRRGPSHLSPLRGSNLSPSQNQISAARPLLQPLAAFGGGGGMRSERGGASNQRR